MLVIVALLSFGLSFIFAMGGVGGALALVPALMAIGIPGGIARPIGLLVNTVSLGAGTIYNLRAGKFKIGAWWPVVLFSLPAAPIGAWCSTRIPQDMLAAFLALFMVGSGCLMFLPNRTTLKKARVACSPVCGASLGATSGVIGGMLGVGGGGVIVPVLYGMGFRSHHIAMVTALVVPFASFTGFIAYAAMGSMTLDTVAVASLAALAGGILGTKVMHRIDQLRVKQLLALTLIVSGVRLLWKLLS
ncbi:sulfite exporter TauE/SafE family protein [Desulfosediminicola sp.]|uniref:sulfite exporter TauE/SafE family protein n=1 Tax=Desulfosediminicola sp. TaxID=2886825 RepID=UPI003AF240FB